MLTFDEKGRSQLLTDGKSAARYRVLREDAVMWAKHLQEGAGLSESYSLETDGHVYFLVTEGGSGVTPALNVESMAIILRSRSLRPE